MTYCLTAPSAAITSEHELPDDLPSFNVTVPDPRNCIPARAAGVGGRNKRHPIYGSTLVDAAPITRPAAAAWNSVTLASVEPEFAVTFNKRQSSFAGYSTKTARMMSGLSPHELAVWRELEANPRWVDFDLQRIRTTWTDLIGSHSYLGDYIAVDQDGLIHAGEMKASASYYADPAYHYLMEDAAAAYARIGVTFRRDTGDDMRGSPRRQLNLGRAFGDRFTTVPPRQREVILEVIEADAGTAPLGLVEEKVNIDQRRARALVNAMLCARDISYPLDLRLDRDTPVTRPKVPTTIPDIRAMRHELTSN